VQSATRLRLYASPNARRALYSHIRETFGLSAQVSQLAICRVAGSSRSGREAIKELNKVLAALDKPLKPSIPSGLFLMLYCGEQIRSFQ